MAGHMDPAFEGNGMFQFKASDKEQNGAKSPAPPYGAAAGAAACSVGAAAACSGGQTNHYPSAAQLNASSDVHSKLRALETQNRLLEAKIETMRKTSSAWGHHHCDGCKRSTGNVRFRCMTCPDMDYCVSCVTTNNKFCGHTMQVIRGGFPAPSGVGIGVGGVYERGAEYAQHGYGAGKAYGAGAAGVGFVGVGRGPL